MFENSRPRGLVPSDEVGLAGGIYMQNGLWQEWESAIRALEERGLWSHAHTSEPLHYDEESRDERVKIYVYRVQN